MAFDRLPGGVRRAGGSFPARAADEKKEAKKDDKKESKLDGTYTKSAGGMDITFEFKAIR